MRGSSIKRWVRITIISPSVPDICVVWRFVGSQTTVRFKHVVGDSLGRLPISKRIRLCSVKMTQGNQGNANSDHVAAARVRINGII
jgi:hypothetical protein